MRRYTPKKLSNHDVCRPGEKRLVSVRPAGEVRRLPHPHNQIFLFFSSSSVCPCMSTPFLSVDFLVFPFRLYPSSRCFTTMLPASFISIHDSSLASGLEGLRRNLADIGATLPPPAEGSSLGRASDLAKGTGEGLSSTFDGQASGERYV